MPSANHHETSLKLQYNCILIAVYFFKNTILERTNVPYRAYCTNLSRRV